MAAPDYYLHVLCKNILILIFHNQEINKLALDFIPWDTFYTNVAASLTSGEEKYSMIVSDSQWLGAFIEGGYLKKLKIY